MAPSKKLTIAHARKVLQACGALRQLHCSGHRWLLGTFLPCARRLTASSRSADVKLAAGAYALVGDLHDLNGTPRAAVRAYQRALKLQPKAARCWHSIGCMFDNMGRFQQARHALMRAVALAPKDDLLAGDLERVEWALLNPCPVLYDAKNPLWHASEALTAGQHRRALEILGRRRTIRARQIRARIHATRRDASAAINEWSCIAAIGGKVQLQHADWFYTLRGPVSDDAAFWRLLLWKIRPKLEGGARLYSPSLAELDMPEPKRFELFVRFELARCERDVTTLLALAGRHPSWREPGEAALRLG